MILLSLFDVVGRLHPVLVHLPIGILLLACLFQWMISYKKYAAVQPAIKVTLFFGVLSAIAACATGLFLSQTGDYDETLVNRHQWLGIAVMIVSVVLYVLHKFSISQKALQWVSLSLIVLIMVTGHMGGSLTHGSDYLTEGLDKSDELKGPAIKPITNIAEAKVYADMVEPLLKARCYNCHGPSKNKGKLRLDGPELILKGGKTGSTVLAGKPGESEMINRLLLPLDDKDHMPPKEKIQLTPREIALLHWWISTGADFLKKTKELPQTEKIKPVLLALQAGSTTIEKTVADVPAERVPKADVAVIKKLQDAGVLIVPVTLGSNYLSASFVNAAAADSTLKILTSLQKQLLSLNLGRTAIVDEGMLLISKLSNLRKLNLNNTNITDKGVAFLKPVIHLQDLNLVGTKVSVSGVLELKDLKEIKSIYLYQSNVKTNDWAILKKTFPDAVLDSGGYTVPTFAKDTTEVIAPIK